MDRIAQVAAINQNLFDVWRTLAGACEGGELAEEDELLFVSFGIPVVQLNAVFVTAKPVAAEATLERAREFFGSRGLPYLVRAPEGVARVLEPAARRAGMAELDPLPGMVLDPLPATAPPVPEGLAIRSARAGEPTMADYQRVLSQGFEVPPGLAEIFAAGAAVAGGRIQPLVGYLDDEAVACSAVFLTGRVAGLYNVATGPGRRRRGFGQALTWAAIDAGRRAGAGVAVLQSTPSGEPVYRKMGFRRVTCYRHFG